MSSIDINPIIDLSCLEISEENKVAFSKQIEEVLDYMSVLNNVTDTADSDFEWPINKDVLIRKDSPKDFHHPLVSSNAPDFKDDSFVVPKIAAK